jgi:hypothetical protein
MSKFEYQAKQSDFVDTLVDTLKLGQTETQMVCPTCEATHLAKDFTWNNQNDGLGTSDENGRGYSAGGGSSEIYEVLCPTCFYCTCWTCDWCQAQF